MVPSKWVGIVILTTMLAAILASLSMTMPLFAVGIVDDNGHTRNEVVVHKDYLQHNLVITPRLGSEMNEFTAMVWIWMFLSLVFVGLLLSNVKWGSVIQGWILVLNGMIALSFLTGELGAASGNLVYGPYIKGFYGHVTSSSGVEWAWGPDVGWWMLLIAVVLQTLAVAIRTFAVFREYQDRRAGIGPPPVQDEPKPT
jgi:hypothetical protein